MLRKPLPRASSHTHILTADGHRPPQVTEELAEPLYHLSLVLEEESNDVLCPELQHQFILLSEMLMNSLWLKATMPSDALEWDEGVRRHASPVPSTLVTLVGSVVLRREERLSCHPRDASRLRAICPSRSHVTDLARRAPARRKPGACVPRQPATTLHAPQVCSPARKPACDARW